MRQFFLLLLASVFINISFSQNVVNLNIDSSRTTISKYIYGQFSEHLGQLIYHGLYVGDSSKSIPNTNGIRNDVIWFLRKLKVPVLRWPGGCFADTYHWKDGIGPKNKRPSIVNTNWGGVTEDNSFGTHEFLKLCELIGTEPYFSANVGSGSVQELADWVQYVNFDGKSPMSNMRKVNGHEKGWQVKFWGIGNEAWGCGGNMTPEHYADVYRTYVTFMSNVSGKRLFRIASGASDADYHWTETLLKNIPSHMIEGIAMHHYSVIDWNKKGSATDFSEEQYFTIMKYALNMEELVSKHSAIMDKYDPKKKIALVVDEWGGWYDVEPGTNPGFLFQQNTMRDAMVAGVTLNIFNNHAERVRIANLAQVVNVLQAVILTDGKKMILTPTYHVMEMYNVHQGATLIPVSIQTKDYLLNGEKLPAVSVSASLDSLGNTHISLVNIDAKNSQSISINLNGSKFNKVNGRILTSGHLQDHNTFLEPEKIIPVKYNGAIFKSGGIELTIPPFSVIVLELK